MTSVRNITNNKISARVVVLGAGFGGLEIAATLSEAFGGRLDLTLIDKSDAFVFGFSKLDVMFGRKTASDIRIPYSTYRKPGVRFVQAEIRSIDPGRRRVTTDAGVFNADILVAALGAELDPGATPGLIGGGNEYYSVSGAEALRPVIRGYDGGPVIVGVTSQPFKCPPAPSEAAFLMDEYLMSKGIRDISGITVVMPFGTPIPPVPAASASILSAFAARGIRFIPDRTVKALHPERKTAELSDGTELPYNLFLGIPVHRVPKAVSDCGLAEGGWIPVTRGTLETRFNGVYAVGDVTSVGTPKAGVFAEGAAHVVAEAIISKITGSTPPLPYSGKGSCYMEFGHGEVARLDVDFFGGDHPTGAFSGPSAALAGEKAAFGKNRIERWFGIAGTQKNAADHSG